MSLSPHKLRRVLIADDNEVVRKLIREHLELRQDLEVCGETADGLETVDAVQSLRPDLVILDVLMPRLNGIEVASVLKKNLPTTKTILFTMYGDHVGKYLASTVGVDIILPKAEGLSSLGGAIDSLLDQTSDERLSSSASPQPNTSRIAPDRDSDLDASDLREALLECEERFYATFEQSAVGIGHVGLDGRWLRVNRKLCDLTGYSTTELRALKAQDLLHAADLAADLALATRISSGALNRYSLRARCVRKDAKLVQAQVTVDAVRDSLSRLKYCVHVIQDLSAQNEVQEKLAEALRDLETVGKRLELRENSASSEKGRQALPSEQTALNQSQAAAGNDVV